MIRDRLKALDIKITELSNYLQISRPTMYKMIECYDNGDFEPINFRLKSLFDYICENELIDKRNVINYILNNMASVKEVEDREIVPKLHKVRKYMIANPMSEKTQFIDKCVDKSTYDMAIHYLLDITPLLRKRNLTGEEKQKLEPFQLIINQYTKGE